MSRKTKNRNEMNKNVFDIFLNYMDNFEIEIDYTASRWIYLNQDDKDWCKGIDIYSQFNLLPRVYSVLFKYNEENYLAITGLGKLNDFDPIIQVDEVELNAGIFMTIINEVYVPLKKNADKYEIYNSVLSQHEDSSYNGHDFTDLKKFFESIYIYKIGKDSLFYDFSLEKIVTYVLYNNSQELYLDFSTQTLNQLNNLIFKVQNELPFNHICNSLLSVQWKDSFLEAYKCIESIFHFEALTDLYKKSNTTLDIYDFTKLIDLEIGWRPKEIDTLKRIFEKVNSTPIEIIKELKSQDQKTMSDYKWFYQIRNSIVHSRPSIEEVFFENSEWDKLIQATIHIIEQWNKINKIS
ncbi:hypothetical protein MUN89_19685 [Halobacillus salinarum]|uniref:Apea-like HEPN domain-containing protein n=1 Tax=Halobacillus salinarum TaxID=2932257 RepID=A0ABY4EIT7_9BACI|nr:hypothetical protein [Halobacillus salinarum]UOQ44059.1 hypothetical protein MUN89_19685 [Halobacillus salinarum]